MSQMKASLRLTGRVDASLTKALRKTEKDTSRTAKLAGRSARLVSRSMNSQASSTGKAASETGKLSRSMEKAEGQSRRFRASLKKNIGQLKAARSAAGLLNRGLDGVANRWTGMVGTLGLGMAVREVGNLQDRILRLQNSAGATDAQMKSLKKNVYGVASSLRVAPEEMWSAVETYVARTGDFAGAVKNLRAFGLGIKSSGAMGADIGGIIAAGRTALNVGDGEQLIATLLEQGKVGSVEMKDLSGYYARTAANYSSQTGRKGMQGATEVGALMQAVNSVTLDAAVTNTAINAFTREMLSKSDKLEEFGVSLWSGEVTEAGQKIARPLHEVALDLIAATNGNVDQLLQSGVITGESAQVINALMTEGKSALDASLSLSREGAMASMHKDVENTKKGFNSALSMIGTVWKEALDDYLTPPIEMAADALGMLGQEGAKAAVTVGAVGAGGVATLLGGRAAYRGFKAAKGWFSRKKGRSSLGGAGNALTDAVSGSAMAVEVVNWPNGGLGGLESGSTGSSRKGKAKGGRSRLGFKSGGLLRGGRGLLKGMGRIGGKVLRPLGMAMSAFDLLGAAKSGSSLKMGRAAGSLGGGLAGGALGATLGSFLLPGIGTVAGGLIGSLLGDLAGEKAGGATAQAMSDSSQQSGPDREPPIVSYYNTFNITQLPGEDAETLARRVAKMVMRPGSGALYDGY